MLGALPLQRTCLPHLISPLLISSPLYRLQVCIQTLRLHGPAWKAGATGGAPNTKSKPLVTLLTWWVVTLHRSPGPIVILDIDQVDFDILLLLHLLLLGNVTEFAYQRHDYVPLPDASRTCRKLHPQRQRQRETMPVQLRQEEEGRGRGLQ